MRNSNLAFRSSSRVAGKWAEADTRVKQVNLGIEQMLEFRRNGRKMSSQQFFDDIKKDMLAKAEGEVESRLRSLRDPKRGNRLRSLNSVATAKRHGMSKVHHKSSRRQRKSWGQAETKACQRAVSVRASIKEVEVK